MEKHMKVVGRMNGMFTFQKRPDGTIDKALKMAKRNQRLRALVTERLTAAAEEIFALVERTIVEYEEELCRSKEENQRRQQLLEENQRRQEEVLSSQVLLQRMEDAIKEEEEVGPGLKENFNSPCVKLEHEHVPDFLPNLEEIKTKSDFIESNDYVKQEQVELFSRCEKGKGAFTQKWEPPIDEEFEVGEEESYEQNDDAQSAGDKPTISKTKRKVGRTPKPCSVCGKVFWDSRDLKRHTVVHTGEKPFSCSVCEKRFTQKGSLVLHMAVHTGDKPFSCSVCRKSFTLKGNLQAHALLHSGDKPFSCSVCRKSFTLKKNLQAHALLHSGERPFSCSVCGARFTLQTSLIRHRKAHTGDRPFSCCFCDKRFFRKEHLTKHMQTHCAT